MKITWEKGVNHHADAENMMKKAQKYNFTPVQMIEVFILNELNIELDETKALFFGLVLNHENNRMNSQYEKGVTAVFIELNDKIEELENHFK